MFKTIALVAGGFLIVALSVVLILAAMQPDTFEVARSTSIKAPPEKIFPYFNDFQRYLAWSPYEKLDPLMVRTYSGPSAGPGAKYAWESSGPGGVGSMTIAEVAAPNRVTVNLDFVKPFTCHNQVDFTMEPQADGQTKVTWAMKGPNNFMGKIMHVFIDCDTMVGADFESGLAELKAVTEK